jgi:hypothetical protein
MNTTLNALLHLLLRQSETISAVCQNNFLRCPIFSPVSLIHSSASTNLKCVTLRFVNRVDMIETPLRSIINSGIWRPIMTPTYSTMTQWSSEPLRRNPIPFVSRYFTCPRSDRWYPLYLVQSCYPTSILVSFRDITFSWTLSRACKLLQCDITERAQNISLRHLDGQIPLLIHEPQLTPSEYLTTPL